VSPLGWRSPWGTSALPVGYVCNHDMLAMSDGVFLLVLPRAPATVGRLARLQPAEGIEGWKSWRMASWAFQLIKMHCACNSNNAHTHTHTCAHTCARASTHTVLAIPPTHMHRHSFTHACCACNSTSTHTQTRTLPLSGMRRTCTLGACTTVSLHPCVGDLDMRRLETSRPGSHPAQQRQSS